MRQKGTLSALKGSFVNFRVKWENEKEWWSKKCIVTRNDFSKWMNYVKNQDIYHYWSIQWNEVSTWKSFEPWKLIRTKSRSTTFLQILIRIIDVCMQCIALFFNLSSLVDRQWKTFHNQQKNAGLFFIPIWNLVETKCSYRVLALKMVFLLRFTKYSRGAKKYQNAFWLKGQQKEESKLSKQGLLISTTEISLHFGWMKNALAPNLKIIEAQSSCVCE